MKKHQILIVEDIAMIANFIQLVLHRHGFEVTGIATSGEEAIRSAADTCPDLILMDIKLRGYVDGIEAAHIIRSNTDIPVVFVSAHTEPDMIDDALATGAQGYIIKPFKSQDLVSTLEKVLGVQGAAIPSCERVRTSNPRVIYPS